MSYSSRAFELVRQGFSEAEAYEIVAAERRAAEGSGDALVTNTSGAKPGATAPVPATPFSEERSDEETPAVSEYDLELAGQLTLGCECCDDEEAA